MSLIINESNLEQKDIQEHNEKVRVLLVDDNDNILVANYGQVYLLPGGSIDQGENLYQAALRELKEETGMEYNLAELEYLNTIEYYQKDYPKRNNSVYNRLIKTNYLIARYKGIDLNCIELTEKERKDNFKLELVSLDDLEKLITNNKNDNPRNIFFQKELLTILEYYKKTLDKNKKNDL